MILVGIYESTVRKATSNTIGWKILCEQEKTPFKVTSQPDCHVTVFDGDTPDWFEQYMKDGGIGIVSDCHPSLLPFEVEYVGDASIEYADLSELGSTFARIQCLTRLFHGLGYGKIQIHENRITKVGIIQDEFPVVLFHSYGKGGCFFTGLPLSRLVTVFGDSLRLTTSFSRFSERVVSIDKHHLLKAMREILIMAFHKRDLPYIHLGYFPNNYQSAITFRIDVDGVFGENLLQISESGLKHDFTLTFFLNRSLCKDDVEFIKQINPVHEIGNHADIHNLFSEYELNRKNVLDCKNWLRQLGVDDNNSFAAPRGLWNHSLHKALDDLGYLYTSDFGVGINGYPFFPYIDGVKSNTLQIPVNPFSAERAAIWKVDEKKKQIDQEFVADFFLRIIKDNYQLGYPIMLYSHPEKFGPMADYVFQQIEKKISTLKIWKTSLTHFATWWSLRDKIKYSVERDFSTKKITVIGNFDPDINVKEI